VGSMTAVKVFCSARAGVVLFSDMILPAQMMVGISDISG
jgi:hypothetical protein